MSALLNILATWIEEEHVWVAESNDVPGLAAEAATIPDLLDKLKILVPEMLQENSPVAIDAEIRFKLLATVISTAPSHVL